MTRLLFLGRHDWANICNRVARALNSCRGESAARVWTLEPHPFGYPEDAVGAEPPPDIEAFAATADWVVTTGDGDYFALDAMEAKLPLRRDVRRAATHAGSAYRHAHRLYDEADRLRGVEVRFIGLDSIRFAANDPTVRAHISPAPLPILPHPPPAGWRLRVVHAPSDRTAKGTDAILAALREVPDIDLDVIEGVSYQQCRAHLSAADVLIDQINPAVGGIGALAIEAMALGVPVVSDMRNVTPDAWRRLAYPECPVLSVRDASELPEALQRLREPREWMRYHLLASEWVRANASLAGIARLWAMPGARARIDSTAPPKISAPMIVRDEERGIAKALDSLVGVVDEVVVVDTGSTDQTVAIVEEVGQRWAGDGHERRHVWRPTPPGATVTGERTCATCGAVSDERGATSDCPLPAYPELHLLHHPWQDDFSEARNFAQDACTGDWCVILDGDEALAGTGDLRNAIHGAGRMAVDALQVRLTDGTSWRPQIRAYRRDERIRWQKPIHNQLVGQRRVALVDGTCVARTYDKGQDHRSARTVPMLLRYVEQHPDDVHGPFFLAQSYFAVHDWPELERWARRCVDLDPARRSTYEAWVWLALAVTMQRGPDDGIVVVQEALRHHIDAAGIWRMVANLSIVRSFMLAGRPPYDANDARLSASAEEIDRAFRVLDFDVAWSPARTA